MSAIDVQETLNAILVYGLFLGIPIGSVIWFIVSMILFLVTKKDDARKKGRLVRFIISGAIALTFVALVVAFFIALAVAIANM